jgi:hypothetical protein
VLISFSFEVLLAARKQRTGALGAVLEKWNQRKLRIVREIRPEYLICDVTTLPRWGRLRMADTRLMAYEIQDARLALQLASRGVDLVETFAVGELLEQLELARSVG